MIVVHCIFLAIRHNSANADLAIVAVDHHLHSFLSSCSPLAFPSFSCSLQSWIQLNGRHGFSMGHIGRGKMNNQTVMSILISCHKVENILVSKHADLVDFEEELTNKIQVIIIIEIILAVKQTLTRMSALDDAYRIAVTLSFSLEGFAFTLVCVCCAFYTSTYMD